MYSRVGENPVRNLFDFGFYVTFFPQLVAGPIVKASDFIPQLYRKYCLSRLQFGMAVFWILNGLLKKIILSDYLAVNLSTVCSTTPCFSPVLRTSWPSLPTACKYMPIFGLYGHCHRSLAAHGILSAA